MCLGGVGCEVWRRDGVLGDWGSRSFLATVYFPIEGCLCLYKRYGVKESVFESELIYFKCNRLSRVSWLSMRVDGGSLKGASSHLHWIGLSECDENLLLLL